MHACLSTKIPNIGYSGLSTTDLNLLTYKVDAYIRTYA